MMGDGGAAACTIYATAVMGLIVERSPPLAKPDDLPETLSLDLSRFQRARIEFVCLADRAAVFALASGVVAVLDSKAVNAKSKREVGICNHCLLALFSSSDLFAFLQILSELAKLLASDTSFELNVSAVLDTTLDNAGVYLEPGVKHSLLRILQRGVVGEDSVRKLR